MLIQACQQFENVEISLPGDIPLDAKAGNPTESKYIVLERANTILLLSSVSGGVAVRGAYTKAFTKQLSKSNGKLEIEQMNYILSSIDIHPRFLMKFFHDLGRFFYTYVGNVR